MKQINLKLGRFLSIVLLSVLAFTVNAQLISWQFAQPQEFTGKEERAAASNVKEALEVTDLIRGPGAKSGPGNGRGFAGNFPFDMSSEDAIKSGAYYQFSIQVKPGYQVSLSKLNAILRIQENSAYIYRWFYSMDGKDFKPVGAGDVEIYDLSNNGVKQDPVDLSAVAELQKIEGGTEVQFRLYGWGGTPGQKVKRAFGFGKSNKSGSKVLWVDGTFTGSGTGVTGSSKKSKSKPVAERIPEDKNANNLLVWQFGNPEFLGKEELAPASFVSEALEATELTRGVNAKAGPGNRRGFTGIFPINKSKDEARRSGSYYQFVLKVKPGYQVSLADLNAILRIQANSAYIYRWMYSFDGRTFTDLDVEDTEIEDLSNNGVKQHPINLSGHKKLQNMKGGDEVIFRLYGWGGLTSKGSGRAFGFGKSNTGGSPVLWITGYWTK